MADSAFKINQGITLSPQSSVPTSPVSGDVYYDAGLNTYVLYQNGKWINLASRVDVASAASLTSTEFTTAVVQNSIVRITGSTTADIHGLTASVDAKQVVIYNNSSATATVKSNSGTEGTAANRIVTPAGTDVAVTAGQSVVLAYDSAQSRWVVISSSGGGGGGGAVTTLTATAGENLTALDAVYIASSTDTGRTLGRAYKLDVTNDNRAEFVGFVTGSVSSGSTATIQIAGTLTGFTGLPTGKPIFGSTTTPGSYQTSAPILIGQYIVPLGESVSSTDIAINAAAGATVTRININKSPYIKNYVLNSDFESNTASSWSLFNTTLDANKIPTGSITAGAASLNSLSATASGKLAGGYSLSVSSPGAITAGHGFISDAFTIDAEDQAKVLGFRFAYSKVSGTVDFSGTSANTFAVYIYDTTAGTWIQPAGVYNLVQDSGVGICTGTFQTAAASTQYRIAVICITATAGAVSMLFDDFYVGPQPSAIAPAMGDVVTYTPTIVGLGATSVSVFSKRVGDSLEIHGSFTATSPTATLASISLGFNGINGNVSVDTSKLINGQVVGHGGTNAAASTTYYGNLVLLANTSSTGVLNFGYRSSTAVETTAANGNALVGPGTFISFYAKVPIAGWSSNTVSSADTDTRVIAAKVAGVSQPVGTASWTQLNFGTVELDTANIINSNTFVVPVAGVYQISATTSFDAAADFYTGYTVNDATLANASNNRIGAGTNFTAPGSVLTAQLKAGDVIRLAIYNASLVRNVVTLSKYSIQRISGPAVVQATETVAALYQSTNGPAIGTSYATLAYNSKVYDTHNAYSGSTYTIPVSGKYMISVRFSTNTITLGTAQAVAMQVWKNGSYLQSLDVRFGTGANLNHVSAGTYVFSANAGDTIQIYALSQVATNASPNATDNFLTITRVGN